MEWIRDRTLTLALMVMFLLFLAGQLVTGRAEYNAEQEEHGQAAVVMYEYLATGHPWEALFENWESEFLQMAVFVLLTTFLIQKGSPESRRPGVKELVDTDPRDFAGDPDAPSTVRRGGWILRLYEHSLGLAFVLLFLIAWVGHGIGGFAEYAADHVTHGLPKPVLTDYLLSARFWLNRSRTGRANFGNRVDGLARRVSPTTILARIETRACAACGNRALKGITMATTKSRTGAIRRVR